jgi:pimeloyl-ACP methyl ester carboxylesterase
LVAARFARLFYFRSGGNEDMFMNEGYIPMQDGVRLFYRKVGEGSQVVLIPNGMYLYDDFKGFADSRTIIVYDVRNRGFSDAVSESSTITSGVLQDAEDLHIVRAHFGMNQIDLIGHSYIGFVLALYATKYPAHVNRMVQIGSTQPNVSKKYPDHLMTVDSTLTEVFSKLAQAREETLEMAPEQACKKIWSILRVIYVANPEDAGKIDWGRCDLPNERNAMKYWMDKIFPSIQKIQFTSEQLKNVNIPVLLIHGIKDRSAPYVGARDWALIWPNARLLTVENAAHAPWIESPEVVLPAITDFLEGKWPQGAEKVMHLEPQK